ncbi:unnamed protein product [Periconia digitata]|uniref:Uncharacterized protein n=1 Tax=Periconia digitata TaxID=1303443 RepID=A0A9W4U7S6_9PLEO|nr:unnamed protein product [Periconia digitata]
MAVSKLCSECATPRRTRTIIYRCRLTFHQPYSVFNYRLIERPIVIMQFSIFATVLFATLVTSASLPPRAMPYTGPCSQDNCGASGKNCGTAYLCVPWPHMDPALREGCTCSYGK